MNLQQIIDEANNLGDDFLTNEEVTGFVNDAIAIINIETKANFPFLEDENDEPAFPEKWQRALIIPFVKGRIKEKDSSQFEWEVAYDQFYVNLDHFKTDYPIPEEYKDEEARSLYGTELNNVPYIWGGW